MYPLVQHRAFDVVTVQMSTSGETHRYFPEVPDASVPGIGGARVAAYRYLPEVLAGFGVDFREVLDAVGLPTDSLDHLERRLAYPTLGRLLQESVQRTRCDYLGLLAAQRIRLADMGLAGQIAKCGETVGEGLRNFTTFFTLHNSAVTLSAVTSDGYSRLVYAIAEPNMVDTGQLQLAAVTVAFNVLQDLCGHNWQPAVITVASRAPSELRPCQKYFRVPLRFDCDESAVVFESHWLDRPLPQLDRPTRQQIEAEVRSKQSEMLADLPAVVRHMLRKQLLLGTCSIEALANQFGMHRRTLDRQLARHGARYSDLLDAVKHEVACQLLRDTELQVQQIAESLRYSNAANFSTAFRRWAGVTPTAYRLAAR